MEWWTHFLDLLTQNVYFRAGFLWGIGFILAGWVIYYLLHGAYVQWLKMRQFFEPTKKPGKPPVETGPSPASLLLGCIGRTFLIVLVLATAIMSLVWLTSLAG